MGQLDHPSRRLELSTEREDVRRRCDGAGDTGTGVARDEVRRREGVERPAQVGRRPLVFAGGEPDRPFHERPLRIGAHGRFIPIQLRHRSGMLAGLDVRVHQRRVRALRRRLDGDPIARFGRERRARPLDRGCQRHAVEGAREVGPAGQHQRVAGKERQPGRVPCGGAEYVDDVCVSHRVAGVEGEGPAECTERLGPLTGAAAAPRRIVEPRFSQPVPCVGVGRVPREQLLVQCPGGDVVHVVKRLVGADHRALVRGQAVHVQRSPSERLARDRIIRPRHPAPRERELVVGQAERRVECRGALEVARGGRKVPPIELLDAGQVGAERLQRRRGDVRESGADVPRGPREIEEPGRQLVEQRAHVRAGSSIHPRHIHSFAGGHVEDPHREVQGVAPSTVLAQDHRPDPGLPGHLARQVEPDLAARPEAVAREQVVHPLVVHDGQVVPLRQIEAEHAHGAVPEPVHGTVGLEVAERENQHRVTRIHAGGRTLRPEPSEAERGDHGDGGDGGEGETAAYQ